MAKQNAVISAWSRTNVVELSQAFLEADWDVFTTEGTASFLQKNGVEVNLVDDLLKDTHLEEMTRQRELRALGLSFLMSQPLQDLHGKYIRSVDAAYVNLKPVQEGPDIGGGAMMRAAAVGGRIILSNPGQIPKFVDRLQTGDHTSPRYVEGLAITALLEAGGTIIEEGHRRQTQYLDSRPSR